MTAFIYYILLKNYFLQLCKHNFLKNRLFMAISRKRQTLVEFCSKRLEPNIDKRNNLNFVENLFVVGDLLVAKDEATNKITFQNNLKNNFFCDLPFEQWQFTKH